MRFVRVVLFIIALALVGLAVFGLIKVSNFAAVNELRSVVKEKWTIFQENFSETIPPARRKPLTTIDLEENLRVNLPAPFKEFKQEDWNGFWHLLYGVHTEDSAGWLKRRKQLNRQEVEKKLTQRYYRPFGYFGQQQWGIFWQQLLKGKVF